MTEQTVTFEKAMSGAEKIAAALSAGACSLDQALRMYEEGVGLLSRAAAELERIEQRAKELISHPDGTFGVVDLGSA